MNEKIYAAFEELFYTTKLSYDSFREKNFLVTGATGLIGRMLIRGLCIINKKYNLNLQILAVVRDKEKISEIFSPEIQKGYVRPIVSDIKEKIDVDEKIDYIIHGASITESRAFIEKPVEVIMTNVCGTYAVMNLAQEKKVLSVVYLSTMEVYGFTETEEVLTEDRSEYLNPLEVRSCYPESKRMAESLCISYFNEYHVPVKIVRLAQTFGYGVSLNDNRVFAEFARCVKSNKDIILLTEGKSKRMYLDTMDAVTAILTVLLKGSNGTAYNAANKNTYCSIKEMAQMVCRDIAGRKIKVLVRQNEDDSKKYSPPHRLLLDTSKLEALEWEPKVGLLEMYQRLLTMT